METEVSMRSKSMANRSVLILNNVRTKDWGRRRKKCYQIPIGAYNKWKERKGKSLESNITLKRKKDKPVVPLSTCIWPNP